MTMPQIIRTEAGEELVVLPRAEYEALVARVEEAVEDEDDIAIYDSRKAALAGDAEMLPKDLSAMILGGDSRLKAIRPWRGMTQQHLSFRSDISQGYLSDLESGHRVGTPDTIAKLAAVLEVPVGWLSQA
ncbi:helix-turn-helix transcriptional regulator [Acidiphilium acidophilum]|uniref:helix-turn-helix domain-containing protein n=1 Tax=Acidiphilium acidophilum TaxID=76588 RepID=UPI002E8E72C5|nr:helix-turn-helix transcriptional regulator [Acidiphilium acidophilum]